MLQRLQTEQQQNSLAKKSRISSLHSTQRIVFDSHARFRVVVCGRRWGKSRLALYTGLMAAMIGLPRPDTGRLRIDPSKTTVDMVWDLDAQRYIPRRTHYDYSPESPPVVVFAMPTLVQCKKIFWKPLLNLLTQHPTVASINRSECTIKFVQPENDRYYRPDIICLGLNDQDGDRARGLRIGHINCDEFQDMKRGIFDEVVVPALADTPGSTALLTGTPKGKVNHLHDFYLRAGRFDDWKSFHFVTTDNDKLPQSALDEIERSRLVLPPRVFRQEHEASFEDFPGQIYDHLNAHHKVATIPDNFIRTILGVDWGDVNPALTAVGVTPMGNELKYWILESWYPDTGANTLELTHRQQAREMIERWGIRYVYCGHDRPSSIEVWNRDFKGVRVEQAFTPVAEGNDSINGLLANNSLSILSPQCDPLFERMGSYHRKQDKNGNFLDEPASGQVDHDVDATRYAIASDLRKWKDSPAARYRAMVS